MDTANRLDIVDGPYCVGCNAKLRDCTCAAARGPKDLDALLADLQLQVDELRVTVQELAQCLRTH